MDNCVHQICPVLTSQRQGVKITGKLRHPPSKRLIHFTFKRLSFARSESRAKTKLSETAAYAAWFNFVISSSEAPINNFKSVCEVPALFDWSTAEGLLYHSKN